MPSTRASRLHHTSILLLTVATLVFSCGLASAQSPPPGSIALRWNNCYSDGGTSARTFACNTNSGVEVLVISAYPPADMPQLNGAEISLTVWSTGASTPSWWTFATNGCRGTSGMNASFAPPATSTTCLDPWAGQAVGGYDFEPSFYNVNIGRLRTVCGMPGTTSTSVPANSEVFLTSVVIHHSMTVGTGSCSGCPIGGCIGLDYVKMTQPLGVGDITMIQPLPNTTTDVAGWQMDASMPENIFPYHGTGVWEKDFLSCAAAVTAARRPTWGAVKSLYR